MKNENMTEIKCGSVGTFNPKPINFRAKNWSKVMDDNYKQLMALDKKARKAKSLVGRVYSESVADGYAYYLIVAESARTVTLKHVKGCGDDYMALWLGGGGVMDKGRITKMMKMQDEFNALFS